MQLVNCIEKLLYLICQAAVLQRLPNQWACALWSLTPSWKYLGGNTTHSKKQCQMHRTAYPAVVEWGLLHMLSSSTRHLIQTQVRRCPSFFRFQEKVFKSLKDCLKLWDKGSDLYSSGPVELATTKVKPSLIGGTTSSRVSPKWLYEASLENRHSQPSFPPMLIGETHFCAVSFLHIISRQSEFVFIYVYIYMYTITYRSMHVHLCVYMHMYVHRA